MNGLPGNLTPAHIEKARERGEDFIIYHHRKYSLKDLEDGAGIRKVEPKPKTRKDVYKRKIDNSDGKGLELDSDGSEGQSHSSVEPLIGGEENTL